MIEESTTNYMIRDRTTGLFSPGGADAHVPGRQWKPFAKGNVWLSMGALKNHLRQYQLPIYSGGFIADWMTFDVPENWEVVTIKVQIFKTVDERMISARSLVPMKETS